MVEQHDSLCLLPSSMRCLCALLTLLLIVSLGAAIFNSLQVASKGSKSYCKRQHDVFHPSYLCPKEGMFQYYACCDDEKEQTPVCCPKLKFWFLLAIACIAASFLVGISYVVLNYTRNRKKQNESLVS
ncbi:unnamed protein product, partial [Mesorhabditis belari]|uniref:Uncharacterized protein n=1 Tax=Mesorhabditis belari TaxID=2138241 RepID=A0AAF3J9C0_9BILA